MMTKRTKEQIANDGRCFIAGFKKAQKYGVSPITSEACADLGGVSAVRTRFVAPFFRKREKELRDKIPADPKLVDEFINKNDFIIFKNENKSWVMPTSGELLAIYGKSERETIESQTPKSRLIKKLGGNSMLLSYESSIALLPPGEDN